MRFAPLRHSKSWNQLMPGRGASCLVPHVYILFFNENAGSSCVCIFHMPMWLHIRLFKSRSKSSKIIEIIEILFTTSPKANAPQWTVKSKRASRRSACESRSCKASTRKASRCPHRSNVNRCPSFSRARMWSPCREPVPERPWPMCCPVWSDYVNSRVSGDALLIYSGAWDSFGAWNSLGA